eukprot:SAG31_NODE_5322_length_2610_cov_1.405814_2_plen_52_part_00
MFMISVVAMGFLPLIAAAVEGFSIQSSGVIALGGIYFSQAPLGLRVSRSAN